MSRAPRAVLPLWAALVAAAASGALLVLAFPPVAWWWVVFASVPLALLSLIGRRVWAAVLVGAVFGAAFFFPDLFFTARYLGPVPWIALAGLETAIAAVLAVTLALAYRWFPRGRTWPRLTALPALVAGLWVMREQVLGSFPYGGFPWGRLGAAQASGPTAEVASWVGMSGLGFLIVFASAAAIEWGRLGRLGDLRTVLPAALTLVVLIALPAFPTTDAGTYRVAAVQGNGPTGYFDRRDSAAALNAQLRATEPVVGDDVDLLAWPEGAMDTDPLTDRGTARILDALSERVDAPVLAWAVTERDGLFYNTSLAWQAGEDNPLGTYDKRHPVPFGEYVPDRWFFRMLAPDLIDLIGREYTPGTAQPVADIDGTAVGLGICFDVIYDDVAWDAVAGGAEVFVFQTNNADFRGTDESVKQLAFAKMRAIETGRSVVNISTVGSSQMFAPDGAEVAALPMDEAGHMIAELPLRTGLTPAVIAGPAITALLGWGSALALAALGVGVLVARRRARETPAP